MRTEKKFDIEGETGGVRFFENRAKNIEPKGFESALVVPKRHPGREPHDQVENATRLFAAPRLTDADQFPVERARTKRKIDISLCDRLDYFGNFAQRRGKIGIEK